MFRQLLSKYEPVPPGVTNLLFAHQATLTPYTIMSDKQLNGVHGA